jgi:hypothetical protein
MAGPFEKEVVIPPTISSAGKLLYVQAYMITGNKTLYGTPLSFSLPSIAIQGISPNSGKAGDRITITGKNLNFKEDQLEINFGNAKASIIEITYYFWQLQQRSSRTTDIRRTIDYGFDQF